jgi:hypothetical protein
MPMSSTETAKPSLDLRRNAEVVFAFRHSVNFCNLDHIPKLVREVLVSEAWSQRYEAGHLFKYDRFIDFITTEPLAGCGWEPQYVEALLNKSGDAEALRMWRKAITPKAHRPKKEDESHNNVITFQGNSRAYTLDRLHRERPDLYARVLVGELSANAAAIEAGFRKLKLLTELRRAWKRASEEERRTFRAEIADD